MPASSRPGTVSQSHSSCTPALSGLSGSSSLTAMKRMMRIADREDRDLTRRPGGHQSADAGSPLAGKKRRVGRLSSGRVQTSPSLPPRGSRLLHSPVSYDTQITGGLNCCKSQPRSPIRDSMRPIFLQRPAVRWEAAPLPHQHLCVNDYALIGDGPPPWPAYRPALHVPVR